MNSDDTNRKGGNDRDAEVTDQRTGTAASAQESVPEFGLVPVTTLVRTKLSQGWNWLEEMLTGRYHATYGLAVTRILIGFTGLGLILTNFNARHYAFGVGSAWNGEIAEPKSDFPTIWLFSLFHRAVTVRRCSPR